MRDRRADPPGHCCRRQRSFRWKTVSPAPWAYNWATVVASQEVIVSWRRARAPFPGPAAELAIGQLTLSRWPRWVPVHIGEEFPAAYCSVELAGRREVLLSRLARLKLLRPEEVEDLPGWPRQPGTPGDRIAPLTRACC